MLYMSELRFTFFKLICCCFLFIVEALMAVEHASAEKDYIFNLQILGWCELHEHDILFFFIFLNEYLQITLNKTMTSQVENTHTYKERNFVSASR